VDSPRRRSGLHRIRGPPGLVFAGVSDAWNACPAESSWLTFIQLTPHFGGHRTLRPILAFTILQDFCDPDPERGHGLRRQMIMISEGGEKQTAPSRWSR
jgi:hypothetical protein